MPSPACTLCAKARHTVASCCGCFMSPGNHFPQWELYPVKEIGLGNTKAVCSALTASSERKNEVLLSSQRLLYAENALRISKNDESCHHDVGSPQWLCIQICHFVESPEKCSDCRRWSISMPGGDTETPLGARGRLSFGPEHIDYIHKIYTCRYTHSNNLTQTWFLWSCTGNEFNLLYPATTIIFSTRLNTKVQLGYKESGPPLPSILLMTDSSHKRRETEMEKDALATNWSQ